VAYQAGMDRAVLWCLWISRATQTISIIKTISSSMVNVWVSDKQYAAIIKHTEQTPALLIRELLQEEIEKKGWDKK